MIPISLSQAVHVAHGQGYCAHSPMSLRDSFPGTKGRLEDIVGIATVNLRGTVVGWIYRTASSRYYAQANQQMPKEDQRVAGTVVKNGSSAHHPGARYLSAILEIKRIPWRDLTVRNCATGDYSKKI